ncbi:MAG: divergent polysaccharide deacetylase family protein [Deltaproteobacteria bacterium]|jgi:polysaccharide deacetylase 2 family uncharacterized protein YibQ|nr:divergent polysaccharide deacetylase family protein [Deltaproteobacteria bacterium]
MKLNILVLAVPLLLLSLLGLFLALARNGEEADGREAEKQVPAGVFREAEPVREKAPAFGIGPEEGEDLPYEEEPFPGVAESINQVDFALAQTMLRLNLPAEGLRVEAAELKEHKGNLYQLKHISIAGIRDLPVFAQVLRDALIAWAEQAALLRADESSGSPGMSWRIVLDGAVTHYLLLLPGDRPEERPSEGPSLVIVIDDLGESVLKARRLLSLNFPVTFAIWPRSSHALEVDALAHEYGLEVIIHQPMEPVGYPGINPGGGVLLRGMKREEAADCLEENIRRVPHAAGLNNHMGSRLTQDEEAMRVVAAVLKRHGFFALDSLTHPGSRLAGAALSLGVPAFKRDIFLDVEANKDKVLAQLRAAERLALVKGQAVAIGHPLTATLDALEEWQRSRNAKIRPARLEDLIPLNPDARRGGRGR